MDLFSIVLAAGKGARMNAPGRSKVCFEVGDAPAIMRALRAYEMAGVRHHVIVIGQDADEVIQTVGGHFPNACFAFQVAPLGTGNAAKCGMRVLQDAGYAGHVLVVAGDKVVEPNVVADMIAKAEETDADLVLLTADKAPNPTAGRVLAGPNGHPEAIVEVSEIKLSRAIGEIDALLVDQPSTVSGDDLTEIIHRHFPDDTKARKATGRLHTAAAETPSIPTSEIVALLQPLRKVGSASAWRDGKRVDIPASEVEDVAQRVNQSIYLFRADALYVALEDLQRHNAQHEEFLTDAIANLASARNPDGSTKYCLVEVPLKDPDDVLSFNSVEELTEINRIFRERHADAERIDVVARPAQFRKVSEWRSIFSGSSPELQAFMRRTYGADEALHATKRSEYVAALDYATEHLSPETPVLIARSPGRINLLGRHTDHRGSCVNAMAISEEVLMVAAARVDDRIHLRNTDAEQFEDIHFSISEMVSDLEWGDWLVCINSPKTLAMVQGDSWGNYVMAAALRLKYEVGRAPLKGADIIIHGTIPIGSGLSSSSAIVVGAADVLTAVNHLRIRPNLLVDLCGQGEWFVGTRGGTGDHAAIKLSRRDHVIHTSFLPFEILGAAPFPAGHRLVVANSGEEAKKSEGARETFNSRILGYLMGELIFKREFPDLAPSIHHLRDINCANLGVTLDELYTMLKRIPLTITEQEFLAQYGPFSSDDHVKLHSLVEAVQDRTRSYDVRALLLYGLSECERAKLCYDVLTRGDADALGRLWQVSHDGDRVAQHDADFNTTPFVADVSDARLDALAQATRGDDKDAALAARLHRQPGAYGCSTPGIDRIVDLAMRQPGVKGAQMAGAGLGGCVMILVESGHEAGLTSVLAEHGIDVAQYRSVEGAGTVEI